MSNNTTQTGHIVPLESIDGKVRLVVYIISLILGTIGSSIVLIVLITKKRRQLTDHHILLANLAVADMITIWFYVGVHFKLLSGSLYGSTFCKIWPTLSVPLLSSILTITSLAIVRYRRIVRPWSNKINQIIMMIWVIGLWLLSLIVFIPAIIVSKSAGRYCYLAWSLPSQRKAYTFSLFSFQYLIPLVIIAAAYIGIGYNLKHYEGTVERDEIRKENRDIIMTLAIITIIFALFLMPLQVGLVMFEFGGPSIRKFVLYFMNYSDIFAIIHSGMNPFIYGIVPREFRVRYSVWSSMVMRTMPRISVYENLSHRLSKPNVYELGTSKRQPAIQ